MSDGSPTANLAEDLGGGVVFVVTVFEAQPRGSESTVEEEWAFTVTWDGEMIRGVTASRDIGPARAAAERLTEDRG